MCVCCPLFMSCPLTLYLSSCITRSFSDRAPRDPRSGPSECVPDLRKSIHAIRCLSTENRLIIVDFRHSVDPTTCLPVSPTTSQVSCLHPLFISPPLRFLNLSLHVSHFEKNRLSKYTPTTGKVH